MRTEKSSNNKGKAVVVKEEPFPSTLAKTVVVKEEEASSPTLVKTLVVKEEVIVLEPAILDSHHQAPPPHTSNKDKKKSHGCLGRRVQDAGSSSSSASSKPSAAEWAAAQPLEAVPLAMAPPANLPPQQQHAGDSRIVFLKDVMHHCVAALATGDTAAADAALQAMSGFVGASADGDPLQRVAFAFAEALARRAMQPLHGLSWALQLRAPAPAPEVAGAARQSLFALCPLLRVAATAANHAILEAMAAERRLIHVVDLGGASPEQWLDLLRLLAARPAGGPPPPSLRLTVVNEHDDLLSRAAGMLTQEAVRLHVPFVFNPVRSHIDRISPSDVAAFGVQPGQALVLTATLQLHRLIADVVTIELPPAAAHDKQTGGKRRRKTTPELHEITKADALLRVLWDLSPELVVVTEQEADHNSTVLWDRVRNALDYYEELFRDVEAAAHGVGEAAVAERVALERLVLRDEVIDIVAGGEGAARRERHEKMARWGPRMRRAGFEPAQVGFDAFLETAKMALRLSSGDGRKLRARRDADGCFYLYSRMVPMFSVSAWRPARRTNSE